MRRTGSEPTVVHEVVREVSRPDETPTPPHLDPLRDAPPPTPHLAPPSLPRPPSELARDASASSSLALHQSAEERLSAEVRARDLSGRLESATPRTPTPEPAPLTDRERQLALQAAMFVFAAQVGNPLEHPKAKFAEVQASDRALREPSSPEALARAQIQGIEEHALSSDQVLAELRELRPTSPEEQKYVAEKIQRWAIIASLDRAEKQFEDSEDPMAPVAFAQALARARQQARTPDEFRYVKEVAAYHDAQAARVEEAMAAGRAVIGRSIERAESSHALNSEARISGVAREAVAESAQPLFDEVVEFYEQRQYLRKQIAATADPKKQEQLKVLERRFNAELMSLNEKLKPAIERAQAEAHMAEVSGEPALRAKEAPLSLDAALADLSAAIDADIQGLKIKPYTAEKGLNVSDYRKAVRALAEKRKAIEADRAGLIDAQRTQREAVLEDPSELNQKLLARTSGRVVALNAQIEKIKQWDQVALIRRGVETLNALQAKLKAPDLSRTDRAAITARIGRVSGIIDRAHVALDAAREQSRQYQEALKAAPSADAPSWWRSVMDTVAGFIASKDRWDDVGDDTVDHLGILQALAQEGRLYDAKADLLPNLRTKGWANSAVTKAVAESEKALKDAQEMQKALREGRLPDSSPTLRLSEMQRSQGDLLSWLFKDRPVKEAAAQQQKYLNILEAQARLKKQVVDLKAQSSALDRQIQDLSAQASSSKDPPAKDELNINIQRLKELKAKLDKEILSANRYVNLTGRMEEVFVAKGITDKRRRLAVEIGAARKAGNTKRVRELVDADRSLERLFNVQLARVDVRDTSGGNPGLPPESWSDSFAKMGGRFFQGARVGFELSKLAAGKGDAATVASQLASMSHPEDRLGYETIESLMADQALAKSATNMREAYASLVKLVREQGLLGLKKLGGVDLRSAFHIGLWAYDHPQTMQRLAGTAMQVKALLSGKGLLDSTLDRASIETQTRDWLVGSGYHSDDATMHPALVALFDASQYLPMAMSVGKALTEGSFLGDQIRGWSDWASLGVASTGYGIPLALATKFGGKGLGIVADAVSGYGKARIIEEGARYIRGDGREASEMGASALSTALSAQRAGKGPVEMLQDITMGELKRMGIGMFRDSRWHYNKTVGENASFGEKVGAVAKAVAKTIWERIDPTHWGVQMKTWWKHTNGWEIASRVGRLALMAGIIAASGGALAIPGLAALAGLGWAGGAGVAAGAYLLGGWAMNKLFGERYNRMWAERRSIASQEQASNAKKAYEEELEKLVKLPSSPRAVS